MTVSSTEPKKISMTTFRRVSYVFLCVVPFLNFVVVGARAFRVPVVYQAVGIVYFAAIGLAAWTLGARAILASAERERTLALTGILLIVPSILTALLWVGLGPPWQATAVENRMRECTHSGAMRIRIGRWGTR